MDELAVVSPEDARHVRVAVEAGLASDQVQVRVGRGSVEDVLVDVVAGTPVDEEDLIADLVAVGKVRQPAEPIPAQVGDRPLDGAGGVLVEPLQDVDVGASAVVVANQRRPALVSNVVEAPVRVPAVADHVSEADDLVDRRQVSHHRLERLPVGVDVGDDGELHGRLP